MNWMQMINHLNRETHLKASSKELKVDIENVFEKVSACKRKLFFCIRCIVPERGVLNNMQTISVLPQTYVYRWYYNTDATDFYFPFCPVTHKEKHVFKARAYCVDI